MSRGATDNADRSQRGLRRQLQRGGGRVPIVLRLLAPAAAALALVSVITNDTRLDGDLVLVAPEHAAAGSTIALRALTYAGINKPEGPALIHARTRVELKAGDGKTLAEAVLRPGHGPSLEGELRVPSTAAGQLTLRARAWAENEPVEVERTLLIGAPEAAVLVPRALGPLQQLAHGPIRPHHELAPNALSVRVAGGACVPEEPCELFVHIGEPAARLELTATPSVSVEQAPPRTPLSGVVAARVRTHGPEADVELRATVEQATSPTGPAMRAVRLPVALGADAMQLERVVLEPSAIPKIVLLGANATGIADLFTGGHWSSSATVHASGPTPLTGAVLAPGLHRVQLRRDPFESASAAVRSFYVRTTGQSDAGVLRALAQLVVAREQTLRSEQRDALAALLATDAAPPSALDFAATSGYLLAALDDGIYQLPSPTSGYPLARRRALAHREDVRSLALIVLALAAASLVLLLVQRGLLASEQATAVLRASGTDHAGVRREQLRMTLRVVGAALSVLLVFCAIALYLIIRGRAL